MPSVGIIGAGLAGCEAALVLGRRGVSVTLYEMRPGRLTPAHQTGFPAELVCSNSLKSQELPAAQALLKAELGLLDSPLLACAKQSAVAAGTALAVDRKIFSEAVLGCLHSQPAVTLEVREIDSPPKKHDFVIIATGPLSSDSIVKWLADTFSVQSLYFYDAIAPIVSRESVDLRKAFAGSRWRPGEDSYFNCPFTEEEYKTFYEALLSGETVVRHSFEKELYFEACLPLEIIAGRGYKTMAYGPLKPIGLADPRTGRRPFAVCQLRREDMHGSSFGLVACQSRLTQGEQGRIFRMIPGLEHAEFLRYGSCHRNTFVNSPQLLSQNLSFTTMPSIYLAGQLCGNEGYVESMATGHIAALSVLAKIVEKNIEPLPQTTALGSLVRYITGSLLKPFSPTSFHFGLLPPAEYVTHKNIRQTGTHGRISKKDRQMLLCNRSFEDLKIWIKDSGMM